MFIKRKSIFTLLFFVLVFLLVSGLVFTQQTLTEEAQKLKEFKVSYPNTSAFYRGVVAMDANSNGTDELYCDFGSAGLWVDQSWSWTKINSSNPEWIFSFQYGGTDYLLADFGASGLWYWYYSGSWTGTWVRISTGNAISAFATDDDNDGDQELHINFVGQGLWRYDMGAATKFTKMYISNSSVYSLRMDTVAPGYEEGAHDFGSVGLWRYFWASGNYWEKLSSANAEDDNASAEIGNGSAAEELFIDFSSNGLWILDGYSWYKINSLGVLDLVPVRFEGLPDYEILCSFGGSAGLWWWNYGSGYPGVWTKINATTPDTDGGFCEPYDPNGNSEGNGDQEVAVDFQSAGLWQFDYTTSAWTKLNNSDPEFMIRCDWFSDGYDTALVVDFGTGIGLWIWDGRYGGWFKLNDLSPDGVN